MVEAAAAAGWLERERAHPRDADRHPSGRRGRRADLLGHRSRPAPLLTMAFAGWSDEAIEFFEGLEAENTKAFVESHKPVYQAEVLAPMEALLSPTWLRIRPRPFFRPYRDTRFSADKSPYKTTIAAMVSHGGYLQFSAGGLGAGVGTFHMAADQADRYRRSVDSEIFGVEGSRRSSARLVRGGSQADHPRHAQDGASRLSEGPSAHRPRSAAKACPVARESSPRREWLASSGAPGSWPPSIAPPHRFGPGSTRTSATPTSSGARLSWSETGTPRVEHVSPGRATGSVVRCRTAWPASNPSS